MKQLLPLLVLVCCGGLARAAKEAITFEKHIRPIFKANCFFCHGEEDKLRGGLDLRLRRFVVKGGDSGPAIVAGQPENSLLVTRLQYKEMPPGKNRKKLSDHELELIKTWIAQGARTIRPEPERITSEYFTEEERDFWSFQPIRRPAVPKVKNQDRVRTPIDRFILARLEAHGESMSADAEKRTLVRRAYYDLIGLPPTPEEVKRFVSDESADAYERLVDRLLASPHYGERWGRHWLDIAGYADSDGAEGDRLRPFAYRYRDYVIRSFNEDKPFDRFIREQLAGDEMVGSIRGKLSADVAEKLIATGFLQMAPDATETATDKRAAHNELLADTIKIVSSSLLGLTVGCARCHDHRFDPISQNDYYRFRAIFEPAFDLRNWSGDRRLVPYTTEDDHRYAEELLRKQEQAIVRRVFSDQVRRLPPQRRELLLAAFRTPADQRTSQQQKLLNDAGLNLTVESAARLDRLAAQELKQLRAQFQRQSFSLSTIREPGGTPAKTYLLRRGNPEQPLHELQPAELSILQIHNKVEIPVDDPNLAGTGRRLAYASHLTSGKHPLLARVLVNRFWMHHFGQGIVATPGDFGREGDRPSHPDLLDWLACEFVENGWSLKKLHKLIMTSTVYRQSSARNRTLREIDPHNRLLGGFRLRRLEAEIVRDAILAVSGDLNRKRFGPPIPVMMDPSGEIVIGMQRTNAGIPLAVIPLFGEESRRSVYVQVRRSMPLTFMQMFDLPQLEPNCEARSTSTVAPQSLVLLNSPFILQQSLSFARRLEREAGADVGLQVRRAWELAFSRLPTAEEQTEAIAFLQARTEYFRKHPPVKPKKLEVPGSRGRVMAPQSFDLLLESVIEMEPRTLALALLCQMLLSSNEFLYIG
ncbi:MAG: hypothetical protein KatS3mg105_2665 [Gemmatales bacterium]|nr:MAG: hypothetical protein KatS3mg105_2665 [Gemmatales bacterium]